MLSRMLVRMQGDIVHAGLLSALHAKLNPDEQKSLTPPPIAALESGPVLGSTPAIAQRCPLAAGASQCSTCGEHGLAFSHTHIHSCMHTHIH